MKLTGTYQVVPGDGSAGEDDDLEVTEHAPLPDQADDNSNSLKCEDNNQHEIVNTNQNIESIRLPLICGVVWKVRKTGHTHNLQTSGTLTRCRINLNSCHESEQQ